MNILSTHIQILIGDLSRVLDDGSPSQESAEALTVKAECVYHLMATLVDVVREIESNLPLIESVTLNNVVLMITGSHSPIVIMDTLHHDSFQEGGEGQRL